MRREDILPWYESLLERLESLPTYQQGVGISKSSTRDGPVFHNSTHVVQYREPGASEGVSEAGSALASVYPIGHPLRKDWDRFVESTKRPAEAMPHLTGVLKAATNMVRDGRLGTLIEAVRAETVDELLDQATILVASKHLVAATVIAGGALETHLRHLVSNNALVVQGEGSIAKYDSAIAKARKDGTANVYSSLDSKMVTVWGGMRNDAAHKPGDFDRSADDVRRMIEGTREFVARTSA